MNTISTTAPTDSFIQNIEKAIKENEVMACPNIECDKKLISKKKMNSDGKSFLEYYCINESCHFHNKRKFEIENEIEKISSPSFKLTINHLFLCVGLFLITVFSYSSYQLYQINKFLKTEVSKSN